jgi:hypothetical protein
MEAWYGLTSKVAAMAQHPAKELGKVIPLALKTCLMRTSDRMKSVEDAKACTKGDGLGILLGNVFAVVDVVEAGDTGA